jgi:hypothetical protein
LKKDRQGFPVSEFEMKFDVTGSEVPVVISDRRDGCEAADGLLFL